MFCNVNEKLSSFSTALFCKQELCVVMNYCHYTALTHWFCQTEWIAYVNYVLLSSILILVTSKVSRAFKVPATYIVGIVLHVIFSLAVFKHSVKVRYRGLFIISQRRFKV